MQALLFCNSKEMISLLWTLNKVREEWLSFVWLNAYKTALHIIMARLAAASSKRTCKMYARSFEQTVAGS